MKVYRLPTTMIFSFEDEKYVGYTSSGYTHFKCG